MAQRGRRSARPSGDAREEAILLGAERLMLDRSFASLSIEELASSAGLSRSAFYFYFSSKDDVLLALLDRVIREADERVAVLPSDFTSDPAGAWRRTIGTFVEVFSSHRSVAVATLEARFHNSQVDELWSTSMTAWVGYASEAIAAERERGAAAPEGLDPKDLATALNLMNERVLSAALMGETPRISQSDVLDALTQIWLLSIYGSAVPMPNPTGHSPTSPPATRQRTPVKR
jgi:TetR/AcrR family transcriptional regulator, ethionamide resistance regulator